MSLSEFSNMDDCISQNSTLTRPRIDFKEAKKIVFDFYGLVVNRILELNGYDDKNFHIFVDSEWDNKFISKISDRGYVLKIVNSLDSKDEERIHAQTSLLIYLNNNNIRCPKPVLSKNHAYFHKVRLSSGEHIIRILEYIHGTILFKVPGSSTLFYEVGVFTANIDNALQGFDHPGYHKKVQWGLGSAPDILNYVHAVSDEKRRSLVKRIISEFSSRVSSIEDRLEKGLIHGDINEQNIIVESDEVKIKAVIDFGDTHYTCYLYELAIAMTYMIFTTNDLYTGGVVLKGYLSVRNMPEEEIQLLWICIMTRFCQSLVLGAFGNLQDPDNEYILTTAKKGWDLLELMSTMSEQEMMCRWLSFKKS